ncbi:MAG: sel1 repeat family protein [Deltaproteobacteria bacterium]|nr:sel1 repeat family protein [Deltaproteobacteria bacterium]
MCKFDELDQEKRKEHLERIQSHQVWIEELEQKIRHRAHDECGIENAIVIEGFNAFFGIRRKRCRRTAKRCFSEDKSAASMLGLWLIDSESGRKRGGLVWIKKASAKGGGYAQLAYAKTLWTPKQRNSQIIKGLFLKAAKNNCPEAQYEVGLLKRFGLIFKQNEHDGKIWTLRAAKNGHRLAMLTIGMDLALGRGLEPNPKLGQEFLEKAAESGDPLALNSLAALLAVLSNDCHQQKQAVKLWEKAAKGGSISAQRNLAFYLIEEVKTKDAFKRAMQLFKAAAMNGHEEAAAVLFENYDTGRWTRKNRKLALRWGLHAANLGDANSCYNLGVLYLEGQKVDRDLRKAMHWLRKAAKGDEVYAWELLEEIYEGSYGMRRNPQKAIECRKQIKKLKQGSDPDI